MQRIRKNGRFAGSIAGDQAERFWSKVSKSDGCWTWTGNKGVDDYGQFKYRLADGKYATHRAHRVAFILAVRPLKAGELVLHKCDNPSCVRPDHLEAGDQSKNISDCYARGRGVTRPGSLSPMAKLTEDDVRAMRASYSGRRGEITELAKRYGVSACNVSEILSRKMWRHV
jgi:hypothetical protein